MTATYKAMQKYCNDVAWLFDAALCWQCEQSVAIRLQGCDADSGFAMFVQKLAGLAEHDCAGLARVCLTWLMESPPAVGRSVTLTASSGASKQKLGAWQVNT